MQKPCIFWIPKILYFNSDSLEFNTSFPRDALHTAQMGHSWVLGISMSWLRFQTWFDKRICWTGDLLIKTCRNLPNHPSTHYIPIKHFLENENFNVLIKLPFQYDIDVPFSQEKNCGLDFLPKNCGHDFSARSALLPIVAKLQTLLSNLVQPGWQ